MWKVFIALLGLMAFTAYSRAGDIIVRLPEGISAKSAEALAPSHDPGKDGEAVEAEARGQTVTFQHLEPGKSYDLKITLADGAVLHGVDMGWYNEEPSKANAGPISDDDREQIRALVSDVTSFYNISRIITLAGDHKRATVLVERIRSTGFHSDAGGEVIWRMELWYFKNNHGGWQEIAQSNKVLRRERFKTNDAYQADAGNLRWVPALGGIVPDKSAAPRTITISPDAIKSPDDAATPPAPSGGGQPATQPAEH